MKSKWVFSFRHYCHIHALSNKRSKITDNREMSASASVDFRTSCHWCRGGRIKQKDEENVCLTGTNEWWKDLNSQAGIPKAGGAETTDETFVWRPVWWTERIQGPLVHISADTVRKTSLCLEEKEDEKEEIRGGVMKIIIEITGKMLKFFTSFWFL